MSSVKPFYLTKFSTCPQCGGENKLEHMKTKGVGAKFICQACNQGFDFSDYIKEAITNIGNTPLIKIFESVYYEVNKPK